jgi:hypothetical protein
MLSTIEDNGTEIIAEMIILENILDSSNLLAFKKPDFCSKTFTDHTTFLNKAGLR